VGALTQWNNGAFSGARQIHRLGSMLAQSLVMERLFARMRQTAPHVRIVAFEGEAGTGKMLAAQTLHAFGPVSRANFVPCPASHFTTGDVQPLLEEASGGTLFLTRVGDLGPEQQSRLFDFLEWWEHRSTRNTSGHFPQQIFFSSQQPIRKLSASGRLRADLCYRLTAIRFVLPPLRERREDIALLAEHFALQFGVEQKKPIRGISDTALQRLLSHSWPGNVRELQMTISNAVLESESQWIRPIDIALLPLEAVRAPIRPAAPQAEDSEEDPNLDRMIVRHVRNVLAKTGGNKLRAAQMLGISRSTLYRLLESSSGPAVKALV
jgi:DNA-binding NtrC family response regulator